MIITLGFWEVTYAIALGMLIAKFVSILVGSSIAFIRNLF